MDTNRRNITFLLAPLKKGSTSGAQPLRCAAVITHVSSCTAATRHSLPHAYEEKNLSDL